MGKEGVSSGDLCALPQVGQTEESTGPREPDLSFPACVGRREAQVAWGSADHGSVCKERAPGVSLLSALVSLPSHHLRGPSSPQVRGAGLGAEWHRGPALSALPAPADQLTVQPALGRETAGVAVAPAAPRREEARRPGPSVLRAPGVLSRVWAPHRRGPGHPETVYRGHPGPCFQGWFCASPHLTGRPSEGLGEATATSTGEGLVGKEPHASGSARPST